MADSIGSKNIPFGHPVSDDNISLADSVKDNHIPLADFVSNSHIPLADSVSFNQISLADCVGERHISQVKRTLFCCENTVNVTLANVIVFTPYKKDRQNKNEMYNRFRQCTGSKAITAVCQLYMTHNGR